MRDSSATVSSEGTLPNCEREVEGEVGVKRSRQALKLALVTGFSSALHFRPP
ncbi:MAG TPA: hypothetical protein VE954_25810 [Oligoflexus sp.]|nr:hypothetical protein [Oligoflexus sp.]